MKISHFLQAPFTYLAAAVLIATTSQSPAQVQFSAGSPYTLNFDILGTASGTWTDNSTLPGWYASRSVQGAITAYSAGTGSGTAAALYSFGVAGVNAVEERALGSIGGNTPGHFAYGVRFVNNTAQEITNLVVAYTGEEWRNGGNASTHVLAFSYRKAFSELIDVDPNNSQPWIGVTALNFTSPIASASAGALDGNAPANRLAKTSPLTGVTVGPGEEILFRWYDLNDSGNDHALALDDLSITWTSVAANTNPPSITSQPTNQTVYIGNTASFSVSAAGKAPLTFQWYHSNSIVSGPIDGAVNSLFTTNFVTTNLAGIYYCIASNSLGTSRSSNAVLTVVPAFVTNIAYLRSLKDANYNLTDATTIFQAEGVCVTPANLVSGAFVYSFYMMDETGKGIDVFYRGGYLDNVPNLGDRMRIVGPLELFSGLLELHPASLANTGPQNPAHKVEVLSSGNPVPAPRPLSLANANNPAVLDDLEGSYVVISNVFLVSSNTAFGATGVSSGVTLSNQSGQTFSLVNPASINDVHGQSIPAFCTAVKGFMSQNDGVLPFTENYQLLVVSYADLVVGEPPTNTVPDPIPLNIQLSGGNAVLTWDNDAFRLQTATSVTGVYSTIADSHSPYTTNTAAAKFFRLIAE